ncbi:MAG: UDP-N-acetylmuramoyl-L-alanyl-D-glutamate--2,6-diaminopimelate ligase [Oscillospiraceae bacterium]
MKLSKILKDVNYKEKIDDINILKIDTNSRVVDENTLFFCISGINSDGHNYAQDALKNGARYIVTEKDLNIKNQIIVEDTKKAYAIASCNFFSNPSKKLKVIGVTGTNGKTSTTYIIKHILESNGYKTGLIGTIKNLIGDFEVAAKYTTPQAFELNGLLNEMVKEDCEYVVMEVSSHALAQHRVFGIDFYIGAFTNLTQDHLDYHKTMDEYFSAKKMLFNYCENVVTNLDDEYGKLIFDEFEQKSTAYAIDDLQADVVAKNLQLSASSVQFEVLLNNNIKRVNFNMPGRFSTYNTLAAIAVCSLLKLDIDCVVDGLKNCKGVKGRAEVLYNKDFTIICDYAHTADGLSQFLESIKPYVKGRLIALFGCAGERDWSKREEMGKAVASLADFVILTSDNPRKEDPLKIIEHTEKGILDVGTKYKAIADRYGAILWAMDNIKKDDVLCLLGKGHEDYQVLYSTTVYFDEHKIVEEILTERNLI